MPAYYGPFSLPTMLAQPADLAEWTQTDPPDNAETLLRAATSIVLDATNMAYYNVDSTTGLATDPQIGNALRDATCAQAAAMSALGVDPLAGGVVMPGVESSKRIGTAGVTYADAADASQARQSAAKEPVPEAERILRLNNLLIPNPWVFG